MEDRTLLSNYSAATVSDLIADINAANAAGGTNTITLAATKQPFTINQVNNTTDFANGLPVIATNDNLTIVGNGDILQRDTKSAAFRLFEVAGGASLTLMDLTLQNGLVTNPIGGSAGGGGVVNHGTLMVSGCTLSSNSATGPTGGDGGGIFNFGSLTVSGCTLDRNSADRGGGILNFFGTATVQSSTLSNNSAGYGGGLWNSGTMTVSGCTVDHNSVGTGLGGGIYNFEGVLTISGCTVSHNSASEGGGIYNDYQAFALTISNSLVCGNTAKSLGADLYSYTLVTITNSTVCDIFFVRGS